MKSPKRIKFDKLVSLVVEQKEEETLVVVNWATFYLEDKKLKEEIDTLTVKTAREIEAKYKVNEEGKYNPEDIEAIQEEVKQYKTKEEVLLFVWDKNVLEEVDHLMSL